MGLLTKLLKGAIRMVGFFKEKPTFSEVFLELIGFLPNTMSNLFALGKLDTQGKIDEAIGTIDDLTGIDDGAVDFIRDLPAEKEEQLFDHLNGIIRILAYNKIKLKGYWIDPELTRPAPGAEAATTTDPPVVGGN